MNKNRTELSIIIPAYKESEIIGDKLQELADYLKKANKIETTEVLVISNCPEATAQEAVKKAAEFKNFMVIDEKDRMGKGGAVRLGMFEASGRYRMFMDTDLSTPLHHLETVFKKIEDGSDVVIGVRDLVKIHKGFLRKYITKLANIGAQVLVVPGIKDTQCGFKLFSEKAAKDIFSRQTITGWSFDVELLAIARKLGYKIETIDIDDWKDPKEVGLVGDNPVKIVFNEAKELFKIRLNLWVGKYKKPNYTHTKSTKVCYPTA
ncbi:MAG: glycosyltransferase [Candidatus Saccharimonadales bacterium]